MANNQPPMQPPAGFQRPGIPGAGNLLDPEVRGELREKIQQAARDTVPQGACPAREKVAETQEASEAPVETPQEAPKPPAPKPRGEALRTPGTTAHIGPFPHGDVDLSGLVPNVAHGVRPRRGRQGRRFYFLSTDTPTSDGTSPPPPQPPAGPKPG